MPKIMWPFGRRRTKKNAKLNQERRPTDVTEGNTPVAASGQGPPNNDALHRKRSRRNSRRKKRSSRSTSPTPSPDPEKADPEKKTLADLPPVNPPFARHQRRSAENITALPGSKRLSQSPHLRPVTQDHSIPYDFQPGSHSSLPTPRERGKLQRPQSLRKSVNESSLVRRKSSRKRQHDSVREEEIRAMSMPLPQKRPAGGSGGMLRRESKKVKGGLNRHFERPTSNISLPPEESIHSSMSGNSETRAWRVSALDIFSPRPTIRCSVGSQHHYTGAGPSPNSDRSKREQRSSFSREGKDEKQSKTIDDLADTLDAGALREILERDKRRREKKRKADDERLRRRLERRAEKQRAQEKALEEGGTPGTPHKPTQEAVGLGIGKDEATPMEDIRTSTPPPEPLPHSHTSEADSPDHLRTTEVTVPARKSEENDQLPTPVESPTEEPIVADAQAVRYSRASMSSPVQGHTRGPSNVSHLPELLSEKKAREAPLSPAEPPQDPNASGSLHPVETSDTAATSKKSSWTRRRSSEGRRMGVFAAFFRRGKRGSQDQARATPSEASFSNTSRESMSRQPLPPHLVAPTQPIQIKRPSSVPRRTMSKFREDLPEYPLSPPDSRVHSPEATSALATRRGSQPPSDLRINSESPSGNRTDSPVSPGVPAAGLMSQSLASVDSEGSWLSGKPMNRRSNKSHLRSSVGSSGTMSGVMKRNEEFNASYEELGIPDDEYFRKLTPQPDEKRRSAHSAEMLARKASSTVMAAMNIAESDDEDGDAPMEERTSDEEIHSSVARQPTVVHRNQRVKSTEALVSYFSNEDRSNDKPSPQEKVSNHGESNEQDSPTSEMETPLETPMVQRATSVDLGKHHHSRQLSAGSAKLLDIPAKRSSVDPKRSSATS